MKIQLKGRVIPRNAQGDPAFRVLGKEAKEEMDVQDFTTGIVRHVFTDEEIVELVNRALYQLEYQHNAHRMRGQRERERERELKAKVREMFGVGWMKATPEQVERARKEVEKGKTTGS